MNIPFAVETFSFDGIITAITPLAVSRPGDNFRAVGQSDKLQRLPRSGPKSNEADVYFPTSTINGAIRRAGLSVIRNALQKAEGCTHPFSVDEVFMLVQGIDTTQALSKEASQPGLIEEECALRKANPFLSLFGRWGLPGHISIGDAVPIKNDLRPVIYVTGNGVRTNDWARNASQITFLDADNQARLKQILIDDSAASKDIAVQKAQIAELKKELRTEKDQDRRAEFNAQIAQIEAEIESSKEAKEGSKETLQRPLDGYEVIAPWTEMTNKIVAANVTPIDLGLFIESIAEFSRDPRVGAHTRQGAGEIKAEWEVSYRPIGSWKSIKVGKISLSREEFSVEDYLENKLLMGAVDAFNSAMKDPESMGIDFRRFNKI